MRFPMLYIALVLPVAPAGAQPATEAAAVETSAIAAMRSRGDFRDASRIVLDPRFAPSQQAPGAPLDVLRPTERMGGILGRFAAASGSLSRERTCPTCGPARGTVVLIASDPVLSGGVAAVTVTAYVASPNGRLVYETMEFRLERRGGQWEVVEARQLGVS